MSFFLSSSAANEFGPGIYTTQDFKAAYTYAGPDRAIMIFRNLDKRDLSV
jgi:hypothetical protein